MARYDCVRWLPSVLYARHQAEALALQTRIREELGLTAADAAG